MLLEHPGELVIRDELRSRLWPDDTFVDFEHGLNAAVKRLRDTLGDSADSPRFIETVPRRGYRFIAPASVFGEPAERAKRASPRWAVRWAWVIVAVGAAAATALGIRPFLKEPAPPAANVTAAAGSRAPVMRLTTGSFLNTEPTVSPDGEWVAFASDRGGEGNLDIWMQRLSGGEPLQLTRDAADDREPTFSADGSRIAFRSEREGGGIYVMPAHTSGEANVLVRGGAHGPRFSPDGRWLAYSTGPGRFSTDKTLPFISQTYLISTTGGESTRLLPRFVSVAWPIWSPDGRRLLVTARRELTDDMEWWVVAPGGEAPVKVSGINVVAGLSRFPVRPWSWIEGNRIVYSAAHGGDSWDLWEIALAPESWTVSTEPRRLTTGSDVQGYASIGRGRQLVFSSLTQTVNVWAVPLRTNSGRVLGPARRVTSTPAIQWWPSASEDGRRLGFRAEKLGTAGLWMRDLDSGNEVLLVSSRTAIGPVVTPDGSRVAYWSTDAGIYAVPSSGGVPEKLCTDCGFSFLEDWSQDNTRLLYETGNPSEVFVFDLRSGEKIRVLQRPPNNLWESRFSPDDRWISVLEVLESEGRTRIWVAPFRDGLSPRTDEWVSVTSGDHWDDKPQWSPDGNLMYFTSQRDGFHCLWAQRLRPETKEPRGPVFLVQHFHSARLSMPNTGFAALEMAVTRDKVFINLGELSGNIWTTHVQ